jgi:hypothetical protein
MALRKPYLSKSKLISAWQCPKRLHLEKHHPEYGVITDQMESMFAGGHQVGDVAKQLYGTPDSVEIAFDFKSMVAGTKALIEGGADFPIFEATFRHGNVLIRADVLIPEDDGWRVIEVKASTSVKDYHKLDCAIQLWVMRESGLPVTSISLAHINNRFVYPGNGDYDGLLVEHDLTEEATGLKQAVVDLLHDAREAVAGPLPEVPVGARCTKPYECQFISHCWPSDTKYPIAGLRGSKARLGEYVALGCRDILDVDENSITADTQRRIYRVTCKGEPEILDGARQALEALAYPRYYLDFETIGPAVPIWPGTRPYATIPVQWSCHIEDEGGEIRHEEFLRLSGEPPMRALAEKMIECLGDSGPVLMYTNYEEGVIRTLLQMFPDLEEPLQKIISRLWDLHPVVKDNYYHPDMLGSWSIKAVLPCVAPHMDYAELDGIKEGMAASDGFVLSKPSRRGPRPSARPSSRNNCCATASTIPRRWWRSCGSLNKATGNISPTR